MGRKIIILLLVTMALAPVHLVEAQQAKKVPLVGILTPDPVSARINLFEAFKKGLREVGYVEGQNIGIEVRSAEGKRDRLPTVASELVRLKVDVILTSTTVTAGCTWLRAAGWARRPGA